MYDCVIIGGGPCGLTAALYLRRANKTVLILEKYMPGGQMAQTTDIENYPGELKIDGFDLTQKMVNQCNNLGVDFRYEEVVGCELVGEVKQVTTHQAQYQAKTVLICTGAYARPLNVENEKKYVGKGISYCATCDGNFFKNKTVAVVGGGNTGLEDCLYLSGLANKVYLIHRREQFRGDEITVNKIKQLEAEGKVKLVLNCVVEAVEGNEILENIKVKNLVTGNVEPLKTDGLFVAIGRKPDTGFLQGIEVDASGYIITNEKMATNIDGVFAGGDVRNTPFRQIVTACSDGAIASLSVLNYLSK